MADNDLDEEEIVEHPRHQAQRQQNRTGGRYGHPGASDYGKPLKQVYEKLDEALDIDVPPVKQRRG